MKTTNRFRWILLLLLIPGVGWADRIEGRMNGLGCASKGEMCPTDKDDPHVLMERDFVVQTADGNYFYITNMDWRTKLKFVLQHVRVDGKFSDKLSAIAADEFWVKQEGEYQLEWSLEMAREKQRKARLEQQRQWPQELR
ncbi:hypothetical protein [Sedimenticola sp.]|uniref:hypothetical protein n=1 Tax=Sedimenticola sp. TaxID=1940285 RepID=UPI002587E570|nr:hypothetical protein [Sedimenticola sp.]MCW8904744.1 hypothetical protein [Sedimenticola sp.]